MGALVRSHDWSATPLGPVESWPLSLKTAVGVIIASPLPMIVLWGPNLVQIYNDGYRLITGAKHPAGLGQPTRECWPEVWNFNEPIYDAVVQGEARSFKQQLLVIERHGVSEDAWFDLTYSPVVKETGTICGVLVTVIETTMEVLAERRVAAERELQRRQFEQAPGFICIQNGPEHT
ncbi:MAG: PAS domain-containing protein [Pseudomonadota bacterium]|nr:PAS domain-containing protein [Pseudomonadota bacterium]